MQYGPLKRLYPFTTMHGLKMKILQYETYPRSMKQSTSPKRRL